MHDGARVRIFVVNSGLGMTTISLVTADAVWGYFDVTDYEGDNFVIYTNNLMPCASLAWTEYQPLACGL
jgi:hypothetical protein